MFHTIGLCYSAHWSGIEKIYQSHQKEQNILLIFPNDIIFYEQIKSTNLGANILLVLIFCILRLVILLKVVEV